MTNMNMDDMLTAMDQAFGLRDSTIEELRIPPDGAAHGITYAAMASQELDWEVCREAMADFLQNSFLVVNEQSDDEFDDLDGSFGLDD